MKVQCKISFLVCFLFLTGCGISESIDNTSKKIDDFSYELQTAFNDVNKMTGGFSSSYTSKQYQDLFFKSFDSSYVGSKVAHKIYNANAAYAHLPFQIWSEKSQISREESIRFSIETFFTFIDPYLQEKTSLPYEIVFDDLEYLNNWVSVGSVSVALDYINNSQKKLKNYTPESLYSILKKGLQYEEAYNKDSSQVPSWVHHVVFSKFEAIKLLQFRQIFYSVMAFYKLDPSQLDLDNINMDIADFFSKNWNFKLDDMTKITKARLNEVSLAFEKSKETREFLKSIGVNPVWPYSMRNIIKEIKFVSVKDKVRQVQIRSGMSDESKKSFLALEKKITDYHEELLFEIQNLY